MNVALECARILAESECPLTTRDVSLRAGISKGLGLKGMIDLKALGFLSGGGLAPSYTLNGPGRAWLASEVEHEEKQKHGWTEAYVEFLGAGFSQADARDMADQRADFNKRGGGA